jgi:hypothetical protein
LNHPVFSKRKKERKRRTYFIIQQIIKYVLHAAFSFLMVLRNDCGHYAFLSVQTILRFIVGRLPPDPV